MLASVTLDEESEVNTEPATIKTSRIEEVENENEAVRELRICTHITDKRSYTIAHPPVLQVLILLHTCIKTSHIMLPFHVRMYLYTPLHYCIGGNFQGMKFSRHASKITTYMVLFKSLFKSDTV